LSVLKENVVYVRNVVQENFQIKKYIANVRNGKMFQTVHSKELNLKKKESYILNI
jgi:hypothetical protein